MGCRRRVSLFRCARITFATILHTEHMSLFVCQLHIFFFLLLYKFGFCLCFFFSSNFLRRRVHHIIIIYIYIPNVHQQQQRANEVHLVILSVVFRLELSVSAVADFFVAVLFFFCFLPFTIFSSRWYSHKLGS